MSRPFIEDFDDKKHGDALDDKRCQEFDWESLYDSLGEAKSQYADIDMEALAFALKQLLQWLIDVDLDKPGYDKIIARRALSLLWTINPGYFEGSPSLTKIADRIRTHKATLSAYAAEVTRTFGVRNRGQSHGWNFKQTPGQPQAAHKGARTNHKTNGCNHTRDAENASPNPQFDLPLA